MTRRLVPVSLSALALGLALSAGLAQARPVCTASGWYDGGADLSPSFVGKCGQSDRRLGTPSLKPTAGATEDGSRRAEREAPQVASDAVDGRQPGATQNR